MQPTRPSSVEVIENRDWSLARFESFLSACAERERIVKARFILIKPNLCAGQNYASDSGVVTSRDVLALLLSHLRELNPTARLAIAESDSIGGGFAYKKLAFQQYEKLLSDFRAEFIDLSRTRLSLRRVARPYRFSSGIWMSDVFDEADYFISLGKLKTHNMTTVSISMKNLFGCLPESDKSKHHPWIHQTIADILQVIRPDLQIIDSSPALEGNGPVHGTPLNLDYVIMSNDPVAVDATCARILGFDPNGIRHIRLAAGAGVGTLNPDRLLLPAGTDLASLIGRKAVFIGAQQRMFSWLGLRLQRLGIRIAAVGHIVHLIPSANFLLRAVWRRARRIATRIG